MSEQGTATPAGDFELEALPALSIQQMGDLQFRLYSSTVMSDGRTAAETDLTISRMEALKLGATLSFLDRLRPHQAAIAALLAPKAVRR